MNAAVDLANLRDMTGGDAGMERELFQVFIESSEDCLTNLAASSRAGAEDEWRRRAHAWKGISLNLGADELSRLCKQAQEDHLASPEEKLRMLAGIAKEYQRVKHYLQNL